MYLQELLLILITLCSIIVTPMYLFFRKEMVKNPSKGGFHSLRVIKIININILLSMIPYLLFILMLISVLYKEGTFSLSPEVIIITVIFLIIIGLSLYGNGMYITSIIIEAFTLPHLRKQKSFCTQFIATNLIHGPISHIIIYSGYILALFLLSIIEVINQSNSSIPTTLLIICGIIAGMIYCITQNFNGTIRFQFRTSFVTLFLFIVFYLNKSQESIFNYSLATFFLFFSISFLIASLFYLIFEMSKKNKKGISWYKY